jgi:hypothetical protein
MWTIDPKDKCTNKNKHDHIYIYIQNLFATEELVHLAWGMRERE